MSDFPDGSGNPDMASMLETLSLQKKNGMGSTNTVSTLSPGSASSGMLLSNGGLSSSRQNVINSSSSSSIKETSSSSSSQQVSVVNFC